ncbi:MAG TPA: sugar transferase [Gemmatimonadaceae bacterium]|nr:sugar transferase [Gemmatimonadaceae bacterium]
MPYRGKRALDLILSTVTAPLWVPCVCAIAIVVRAKLGPPVFFTQQRPGYRERIFRLVKFRTMTSERDGDGNLRPDVERLTPFGAFLRSTSLDELPELWNVLRGDMSLVGPRPLLPRYIPLYSASHRRRHDVPPGLTGMAQVRGRNALGWDERLDLDVQYVEQASLKLDLAILVETVDAVIRRRGISASGHATMPEFKGSHDR